MTYGDPKEMSDQVRKSGHAGVIESMDPLSRALCEASGCVADHRRLVAFIYLALHHVMPFLKLEAVMRMYTIGIDTPMVKASLPEHRELAARLSSTVPENYMCAWLSHVFSQCEYHAWILELVETIPLEDDTETVFTNGWIALYAKHIADELESHGEST